MIESSGELEGAAVDCCQLHRRQKDSQSALRTDPRWLTKYSSIHGKKQELVHSCGIYKHHKEVNNFSKPAAIGHKVASDSASKNANLVNLEIVEPSLI